MKKNEYDPTTQPYDEPFKHVETECRAMSDLVERLPAQLAISPDYNHVLRRDPPSQEKRLRRSPVEGC